MLNLTPALPSVFPALQDGFSSISQFHRYNVRINPFTPGNHSNIRAVGSAAEEERDGAYYSQRQITFFPQKHLMYFTS